jgi:hypothetical protein
VKVKKGAYITTRMVFDDSGDDERSGGGDKSGEEYLPCREKK